MFDFTEISVVLVVEPLLVFSMAYLSYITSDLFLFSGIVG